MVAKEPLAWQGASRVVSRPSGPIAAFSLLVDDPADLDVLVGIEALTNPLAREALGSLATIPLERRYVGASGSLVMTPFVIPRSSRFSDGSFGMLYVAKTIDTALREVGHYQALRLVATAAAPGETLRMYSFSLDVETRAIANVRRGTKPDLAIYDPHSHVAGQMLGRRLRDEDHDGVLFDSVRHNGGECAGLFWPDTIADARPGDNWLFYFDGNAISEYARVA